MKVSALGHQLLNDHNSSDVLTTLISVLESVNDCGLEESSQKLKHNAHVVKMGGILHVFSILEQMNLLSSELQGLERLHGNSVNERNPIVESHQIGELKQQLSALIEKSEHPNVWDFLINIDAVKEKNGLIWIINQIVETLDKQLNDELKAEYQKIFESALSIKDSYGKQ